MSRTISLMLYDSAGSCLAFIMDWLGKNVRSGGREAVLQVNSTRKASLPKRSGRFPISMQDGTKIRVVVKHSSIRCALFRTRL